MSDRDRIEAEKIYVQSPEIPSLRELGQRLNRHKSVIGYWKKKFAWDSKRQAYWEEIEKLSYTKAVEKVSDILSEESANLAIEHLRHYQKFRQFGETLLNTLIKKISEADDPIAALQQVNIRDINYLSQLCDRSVKGEGAAVGSHLQIDPNTAARTLESLGYVIIDPTKPPTDVN